MLPIKPLTTINTVIYGDENISNSHENSSCDNNFVLENIENDQRCSQNIFSMESVIAEGKETTLDKANTEDLGKVNEEKSKFSFSDDANYGEPMRPQRLRINFAPTENDTSEISDKCFEFWKFINDRSDLQHLKVYPVKSDYTSMSLQLSKESKNGICPALDWIVNGDKITDAFMVKDEVRYCEQSKGDYCDDFYVERRKDTEEINEQTNKMKLNSMKLPKEAKKRSNKVSSKGSTRKELKNLSKDLEEWDSLHPRSLEPPGQVPQVDHVMTDG